MRNIPERIFVSKKVRDEIFPFIDKNNYFGLGKLPRTDLFIFALSLGISLPPTDLETPDGLAREHTITTELKSLMNALYVSCENEVEGLVDQTNVYSLAEKYANTGFKQIESYMHNKSEENLLHEIIVELDEKYKNIISKDE